MASKTNRARNQRKNQGKATVSRDSRCDPSVIAGQDRQGPPVTAEIKRAAARIGLEPEAAPVPAGTIDNTEFLQAARDESQQVFTDALSALVSGGLFTDDESDGLRAEQALIHVAGAQLKAVTIAMALTGSQQNSTFHEGWEMDEQFDTHDALAAMSGIVALLQSSRPILRKLRGDLGGFVSSNERFATANETEVEA